MISQKAEIAVGTIYTHFKNKESILDYIFQREYEKRADFLKSLQEISSSHIEKFNLFLDFHFNALAKDQDLAAVLIRESANPKLQHLEGVKKIYSSTTRFF
jgi:AcrR family transcriptional regulator